MAVHNNFLKKFLMAHQTQKFDNIAIEIDHFTLEKREKNLLVFGLRVFSKTKIFNLLT